MVDRPHSREAAAMEEAEAVSPVEAEPCKASVEIGDLVLAHHQAIYGYAYRLSGNESDAEDLAQQTFLIAQQKLSQLREVGKARSWLYAILRSCYLKGLRKRQPSPAANLELNVEEIPDRALEEQAIDGQRIQLVLNQLSEEFRIVLAMFYFEECSYKEIAARLELPLGTVMSRLSRAKGRLRQKLLDAERALERK